MRKLYIICILLISYQSKAQTDCKESLYEANKLFEAGNIKGCINLLEPCLNSKESKSKKSKEELIESYHLLAMAYQNNNDLDAASKYVKKMLLLKPDYQKFPNIDPMDFSRLVNQFKVNPKLYLGIKVGFNSCIVDLKKSYSTYTSTQSYFSSPGYQFGLSTSYMLNSSLSLYGDFLLSGIGIKHVIDSAGGWKQNYNEQQDYFMFNIGAQYSYKLMKKLYIDAGLGLGIGYLYSSNVFFESTNIRTNTLQQSTQDPIDLRIRVQPNLNGLIGFSVPISSGTLSIAASYSYFFNNTVIPEKRMDDLNFIFNNQYVNDDISLRVTSVNLSYKFPIIWNVKAKK